MSQITWNEIKGAIRASLYQDNLDPPVVEDEVRFLINGLATSIALAAINTAIDKGFCTEFQSKSLNPKLDFKELPRDSILRNLEHCSGLPNKVCNKALSSVEVLITGRCEEQNEVWLESIGRWVRGENGSILYLEDRFIAKRGSIRGLLE